MQRLRILWTRDRKLLNDAYKELKAQDSKIFQREKLCQRLAKLEAPPKIDFPPPHLPRLTPTPSPPTRPTPSPSYFRLRLPAHMHHRLCRPLSRPHLTSMASPLGQTSRLFLSQQSSRTRTNEPRLLSVPPAALSPSTFAHLLPRRHEAERPSAPLDVHNEMAPPILPKQVPLQKKFYQYIDRRCTKKRP